MMTAIEHLLEIGIDKIYNYNLKLAGQLVEGLASLGAEFVTPAVSDLRSSIVTARFPGRDQARVAQLLNAAGVVVSPRVGAVRFSPHVYNTEEDITRALEALWEILEGN